METFSSLLALCAGNSQVPGEFPSQRPVTRSFDVFFDLLLNKQFSKQSWGWWFEMQSCSLWRHCNGTVKSRGFRTMSHYWPIAMLYSVASSDCSTSWRLFYSYTPSLFPEGFSLGQYRLSMHLLVQFCFYGVFAISKRTWLFRLFNHFSFCHRFVPW